MIDDTGPFESTELDCEVQLNLDKQLSSKIAELSGLNQVVAAGSGELKDYLVDYVGNKLNPEDGNVTVEMIVEVIAAEFPEFLLTVAEENWLRGYEQGMTDAHGSFEVAEE